MCCLADVFTGELRYNGLVASRRAGRLRRSDLRRIIPESLCIFMLAFSDIQSAITVGFQSLPTQIRSDYGVKPYQTEGGSASDDPWRTAGFYAYESRKNRLVLEALYFEIAAICVVRVFREGRLKVFYAKKIVGEAEKLNQLVGEALPVFLSQLPAKPVKNDAPEVSAFGDMAHSLARLLLPVPPPVRLSEMEQL